jgi:hypothetical protein
MKKLYQYIRARLFQKDYLGNRCFWLRIKHRPFKYMATTMSLYIDRGQRQGRPEDVVPGHYPLSGRATKWHQPLTNLNESAGDALDRLRAEQESDS